VGQNLSGGGGGGQYGHIAACRSKATQDVAFGTKIHSDNFEFGAFKTAVAIGPGPTHFVPAVGLCAGHFFSQIQPFEARKGPRLGNQSVGIEIPVRVMGQRRMGGTLLTNGTGQAAGVDATHGNATARCQPV